MIEHDKRIKVIHPRITEDFQCLTDKCPATCCSGWSIIWTCDEVKKLKESCTDKISYRIPIAFEERENYIPIKLDEDGYCPFLSNGLCLIHKELGQEYLSYTCREYPRIKRICGSIALFTCRMTCYAVAERLFSDTDCMDICISYQKELTAIITPIEEATARNVFFEALIPVIWDNKSDIFTLLIKAAEKFSIKKDTDKILPFSEVFKDIYGWDIIIGKENKYTETERFVYDNVIRAFFFEWMINGIVSDRTAADNYCCFLFCAAAIKLALTGLVSMSLTKEELICSFCDFTSALLSDKSKFEKIILYLKDHNLNNILYMENIIKQKIQ